MTSGDSHMGDIWWDISYTGDISGQKSQAFEISLMWEKVEKNVVENSMVENIMVEFILVQNSMVEFSLVQIPVVENYLVEFHYGAK